MRSILLGVALLSGFGCMQTGPLARLKGPTKEGPPPAGKEKDVPPAATTAQRPAPPAELITPDRVSADPEGAAQRVLSEIEADRKTIPGGGKTAEISVIKAGEKVR
jgi:hypothetical protein